jgi:hypothetical protein
VGPLDVLIAIFNERSRDKRRAANLRDHGEIMKQLNVWPMLILLICVVLLVIWLRPHS